VLDARLIEPEKTRGLLRSEYDRLVALGLLEDERVELLHGTLVEMSPNEPAHSSPIQALTAILVPALVGRATVRVQLPLYAANESEPEPDVAIVPLGEYRSAHPAHAHLVIEVAVSSINKDRKVKAPLYAASGFAEYWLVNVRDRVVEVYRSPDSGTYRAVSRHGASEVLSPEAFPDVHVALGDVFGA